MDNKLPNPLGSYVLVEVPEVKKETDSGIILPETKKKQNGIGIIVNINPTTSPDNLGRKVIFDPFEAFPFSENGRNFVFVKIEHLIAFLNND